MNFHNVGNNNSAMTQQDIKESIENYLKYDRVFDYALKKNPDLYMDKLSAIDYKDYWFDYKESDIVFSDLILIDNTTSEQGDFFYIFISDFKYTGVLCYQLFRN